MPSRMRTLFGMGVGDSKALIDDNDWRGSLAASTSVQVYSGQFLTYLEIYRANPAVRQVVAFIAENMAQVPIALYKRVSDDQRERVNDHQVARLLEVPNPELSAYEFMRDLVTDLELFDCAFYRLQNMGVDTIVTRLFPDSVEILTEDNLGPTMFRVRKSDGGFVDLPRGDVLYFHGYGTARGISVMESLKQVISEDNAASEYRQGLYKNGMRNAGVVERPIEAPDWSDTARERFLSQLETRHTGGANTGRPLLLEEGMEWKSDQISMRSEEYISGRELTTRTVANAFRISPTMLGLTDAPYASITEYNRQLYRNALAPRMTFITQSVERQLLSLDERREQRLYVEFNLEAKLRGSFLEQAQIGQLAVGKPWMTVDEFRAKMDMAPLEEQDAPAYAAVSLPTLVEAGIVSPLWAAEQLGAPTEGLSDVAAPLGVSVSPAPSEEPSGEPSGAEQTGAGAGDQPAPSEDGKSRTKAKPDRAVVSRRQKYAQDIADELMKTFDRIVKQNAKAAHFKSARWERELKQDLKPVLERVVIAEGTRKAEQLGGDFDRKYTENYLESATDGISRNVARAADETVKRHATDDDEGVALKTALAAVAARVAVGAASNLTSFARESAAKQNKVSTKTWVVTSENSRHPDMDGETAKVGEPFSNGLLYPGDPSGDPDETAHCECVLDVR